MASAKAEMGVLSTSGPLALTLLSQERAGRLAGTWQTLAWNLAGSGEVMWAGVRLPCCHEVCKPTQL